MTIDYSALMYLATISSRVPLSFKVSNAPFTLSSSSVLPFFTAIAYSSTVNASSKIFKPSVSDTKAVSYTHLTLPTIYSV